MTIRTEYDIFSIEMSKTSLKTKGRREKKAGITRQREKAHKNHVRWKTERKNRMRGCFKCLAGMIWMRGRSESRTKRRPKQKPAAAP